MACSSCTLGGDKEFSILVPSGEWETKWWMDVCVLWYLVRFDGGKLDQEVCDVRWENLHLRLKGYDAR